MNQRLRIGLIGAGGIVRSRHLPNLKRTVWINRAGDWEPIEVPPERETPWTAEADFVHSALHDEPIRYPNPTFTDGVRKMAFTEGVFRSAETGRAVDLPLPNPERVSLH